MSLGRESCCAAAAFATLKEMTKHPLPQAAEISLLAGRAVMPNHPSENLDYVELDRRFFELERFGDPDSLAQGSYLDYLHGRDRGLGWDHILTRRLVVILGEPGSGKSYELRHQANILAVGGQNAFHIELERLVNESLNAFLSPNELNRLERWRKSDEPAIFFLDSVDEAKVRRQTDFHRALERLRTGFGLAELGRARFVISSRISEWRPETDWQEVQSRLGTAPYPHTTELAAQDDAGAKPPAELLVVQLRRLNREQVERLVAARGIEDVVPFVKALDESFAWDFAGRPLDVLDLLDFWKQHGRLGSLTEIIDFDVRNKLKERISRLNSYSLSEQRAMEGAETLAAATLLCRRQQIAVPDEIFAAGDGLSPEDCLPIDWCPEGINALVNRAVFDSASYGRIRFHHRRIGEYLAAKWFAERMKLGCPLRALEQVFFAFVDGKRVLRPSLAPVAAWLCAGEENWNDEFRSWVLEAAPEIHLEYGDAAALPLEYRRRLLRAWIKGNEGRKRVWVSSSPEVLRRLAAQDLASEIGGMLTDKTSSVDIREKLVLLVRFGRLTECVPALLAVIRDGSESASLKRYAVSAMRDIADRPALEELRCVVGTWTSIPAGLCGDVVEALYPEIIDVAQVVALLKQMSGGTGDLRSLGWSLDQHFSESLVPSDASPLLEGLNDLAAVPGSEWVGDLLAKVLLRLLEATALSTLQISVAAATLRIVAKAHSSDREENAKLDSAARRHPAVRQALFWRLVDESTLVSTLPRFLYFDTCEAVQFDQDDFEWLIDDVRSRPVLAERQVALRMALQVWRWQKMDRRQLTRIEEAVGKDEILQDMLLEHRNGQRWGWLRFWTSRFQTASWRFRLNRNWRSLVASFSRRREEWLFWRHRGMVRDGRAVDWLIHLCWEARDEMHRWSPKSWDRLTTMRGAGICDAVRNGCQRAWTRFHPHLPHEKPVPNETDSRIIVGLAALDAIASAPSGLSGLTDVDARLAARYAVNELNGFPDWFTELAMVHPSVVKDVLRECVEGEWQYEADRSHAYDVLADLAWIGRPLAALVEQTIMERLRNGDPANLEILTFALSLLLKRGASEDLGKLALERCRDVPVEDPRFVWWIAVALQFNAVDAISLLECRLGGLPTADRIVVEVGGLLESRGRVRLPQIPEPSFLMPDGLRQLIPLVHRHVRRSEDLHRMGKGAFSPTARDEAQSFRDSLLSRLAQSNHPDAPRALRELLKESVLKSDNDWIMHLLEDWIKREAERAPWKPTDVRSFAREYERDPQTAQDLFQIALNRLSDIQHSVERSDNSRREEIPAGADEYVLRRWLARQLRDQSRQRYTVPQEAEIDLEERPDIRVENPKTPPVSIEVKWAENWTLAQLLERLEMQLVGQYLRDHDSRHGIYFLASDGRKKHWEVGKRGRLSFAEVARIVADKAAEIERENGGVYGLRVVTVDFRDPKEK